MSKSNSKKNVYIHIGHSKTGSTAFQNFLTNNHLKLQNLGIYYPVNHHLLNIASNNDFQIGNLPAFKLLDKDSNSWVDTFIIKRIKDSPSYKSYLFSNEGLSEKNRAEKFWGQLEKYNNEFNFIFIQCYRNPLDTMTSQYLMDIKKRGLTKMKFYRHLPLGPNKKFLENCIEKNYQINLYNYSLEKDNLWESILNSIHDCDNEIKEILSNYPKTKDNRGLTKAEQYIIKFINYFGKNNLSDYVSRNFITTFKNKSAYHPQISSDNIKFLKNKYDSDLIFVNNHLGEDLALIWEQKPQIKINKISEINEFFIMSIFALYLIVKYIFLPNK